MTSRERLLAAIGHHEPDRVPIAPRLWAYLTAYYGDYGLEYEMCAASEFGYDLMLPALAALARYRGKPLSAMVVPKLEKLWTYISSLLSRAGEPGTFLPVSDASSSVLP